MLGKRIHRPDCDLAVELVKEPHPREARLGDLGRADSVISARGLSPALRIQSRIALPKMHEARFHTVGNSEIEMLSVDLLEEARGAQILVVGLLVDIGPEFAGGLRDLGF